MFEVGNLHKIYDRGRGEVEVLRGLDFSCGAGEFIGVFGSSGAGKSTFLQILGGLDTPTSGNVTFDGVPLFGKGSLDLAKFRNKEIGFVFQFYHLLPEFDALENVMIPCMIGGISRKRAREMDEEALSHVDMSQRLNHRPGKLSGGEQQRVAIARAIVMNPRFLLADEPTGNLDEATQEKVFGYFERLHKERNTTIIMVTHNPDLLRRMPKRFELKGGTLHESTI